jgi:hypothetical protein
MTDRLPAKVTRQTQTHLRELLEIVGSRGWAALGIHRTDPPTQITLIEEAVRLLRERATER